MSSQVDFTRSWSQLEPIVRSAARRYGHPDPLEAMGDIWEKLPDADLDALSGDGSDHSGCKAKVYQIASNHFHNERRRRHRWNRKNQALESTEVSRARLCWNGSQIEALIERRDWVERILERLNPADRELLKRKYGIDQAEQTTQEMATQLEVTPQAIRKKLDRIHHQVIREAGYDPR